MRNLRLISLDQIEAEASTERLREVTDLRSQVDYYNFILRLLKDEHKQLFSGALEGGVHFDERFQLRK